MATQWQICLNKIDRVCGLLQGNGVWQFQEFFQAFEYQNGWIGISAMVSMEIATPEAQAADRKFFSL
ncbi:hypothetical protein [Ruegeria atlantica]|uniref:hypothetical protein n=1 Tax=Ruegeria atlantica TaxID=81569 RepID=UPI001480F7A9|nr:hypothetical protein [Ruegeria atlantica]